MDTYEVIRTRKLKKDRIDRKDLETIIQAGRMAPTLIITAN